MKINEVLIESQQVDEGPFTQAVGKVGGKIAKGVAGVGKDLKTGFKAGYSGEQPPASSEPAAKKPGLLQKIGQAAGDFKKGFQQGSGNAAPTASGEEPPATAAPKQEPAPAAPAEKPAAGPTADTDQAANTVAQLQKQLSSTEARIQKLNDDTMENLSMLMRRISSLEKQAQGENKNIVQSNNSIERTGNSVTESFSIFRKH